MHPVWKPHVTVAAVIEREGRFLLVEEEVDAGPHGMVIRYNQPAGHLDCGESLVDACTRETMEETAWEFVPRHLVGIYQWRPGTGGLTYLRFAFAGFLGRHDAERRLDTGIVRTLWLAASELEATRERHRSPLVMQCVTDYLAGKQFPLELIRHYS